MIVVDRIEADRAILTMGGERVEVPVAFLPAGAAEGTVLRLTVDQAAGAQLRAELEDRLARLQDRNQTSSNEFDL